ncbi:MAG TPA: ABC transporter permease [Bryobacteraceae bacterium]|jgi:putative ABC transport system permease protein|nr:ABC transporter permease [Bryobacteraceae bacterium]
MNDLKFATRTLLRNPSFTVAAILALALGIGATTAIFSVVNAVLLKPLPYPQGDRLVSVSTHFPGQDFYFVPSWDYLDWARDNRVFDAYAAMGRVWRSEPLQLPDGPVRIYAARVTSNLLDVLEVNPILGRRFLPEESKLGASLPIVISYGLWQDKFAADPRVLDKSVFFDGGSRQIVGVLPKNFHYPGTAQVDALVPVQIDIESQKDRRVGAAWDTIGRTKPGATLAQARANFETLFAATRDSYPLIYRKDVKLVVQSFQDRLTGNVKTVLLILLAGVGCVLLIACANVANLLLARATARRREIATRAALGASRFRLIRQLLTESLLLSSIGGAAGVFIAAAGVRTLRAIGPEDFPRMAEVTVDVRVLLFALFAALATGIVFGLAPAFSATRPIGRFARSGPRGLLVAAEIALSLTLLIGAALMFQSLWRLEHKNIGFQPEHIITANIWQPRPLDEIRRAIASIPGIAVVAFADSLHPNYGSSSQTFSREGRPKPEGWHRGDNVIAGHISPGYYEALGIPLLRGRMFTNADSPDNTALVNQTLVRTYFPNEDPIGKKIDLMQNAPKTIVGVVADVKNHGLNGAPVPEMDCPLPQSQQSVNIVVRTLADPILTASALRQELQQLDPRMLVAVRTMNQQFDEITARPRFNGLLFGSFAAIALLLAVVGVYGVISFTVARRTQEIGIRMALGADGSRVIRLIIRDALIPTAIGIAVGLGAAMAASRSLASLLYDIKPTDLPTYILASTILAAVGLAAALVPARRAANVDPMSVLKVDC